MKNIFDNSELSERKFKVISMESTPFHFDLNELNKDLNNEVPSEFAIHVQENLIDDILRLEKGQELVSKIGRG